MDIEREKPAGKGSKYKSRSGSARVRHTHVSSSSLTRTRCVHATPAGQISLVRVVSGPPCDQRPTQQKPKDRTGPSARYDTDEDFSSVFQTQLGSQAYESSQPLPARHPTCAEAFAPSGVPARKRRSGYLWRACEQVTGYGSHFLPEAKFLELSKTNYCECTGG